MLKFVSPAIGVLSVILLTATPPVWAASHFSKGGGGGAGGDVAGGLPALEDRVDADEAAISTLQGQVTTLQGQVNDLLGQNNWAVVTAAGTVARSNPAGVTVEHTASSGVYEVTFTKDVHACAFEATIGDSANAVPALGFINVSGDTDTDNPNDVFVQTYNSSAALTDESFHLLVVCP